MEQLGEYDAEIPLSHRYCAQISPEEYEMQTASTTFGALEELLNYVENNPEIYKKIIAKRRLEEEENAGLLSYLKVKLMVALQGEDYAVDSITHAECENEINKFQSDICEVFNYAQDSKQKATRFSKRLEAKKKKKKKQKQKSSENAIPGKDGSSSNIPPPPPLPPTVAPSDGDSMLGENDTEIVVIIPKARPSIHSGTKKQKKGKREETLMSPPPPPPPPPPPAVLQDSTNKRVHGKSTPTSKIPDVLPASDGKLLTKKLKTKSKQFGSTASLTSVGSIQDELRSFDRKLLKSVSSVKSPGGTPQPTPRTKRLMTTPVVSPSMHTAFNMKMLDKFKNIRSPPSSHNSPASGFNSTSDFTP